MAKKPISGARWFEALGRRERSKGLPAWTGGSRYAWPLWAKHAYTDGWLDQGNKHAAVQKGTP